MDFEANIPAPVELEDSTKPADVTPHMETLNKRAFALPSCSSTIQQDAVSSSKRELPTETVLVCEHGVHTAAPSSLRYDS
jgi:hypothetical protein